MTSESKRCGDCCAVKPLSEFTRKDAGTWQWRCKECVRRYNRRHYRDQKATYLAKNARHVARRRDWLIAIKSLPCTDCGMKYPPCVMEFDHRPDEDKHFDVSRRYVWFAKERVLQEIAKCDLVCANCHRLRTCSRDHVNCHRSSVVEQPSRKGPDRVQLPAVAQADFRPMTEIVDDVLEGLGLNFVAGRDGPRPAS